MAKLEYTGNENRIVRVNNDAVHEIVDTVAQAYNLPYQVVFTSYLRWITVEFNAGNSEAFEEWFVGGYTSRDDEIPF